MVLFSDGITEAMNVSGEEFGETRVREIVQDVLAEPPDRILSAVFEAVRAFARGAAQHDDLTAVVLRFAPPGASWVDLGTGAGFPGLIVAALHDGPVTLIEERRLRVDFLRRAAEAMGLRIEILHAKVERVPQRFFDVISARAFAPLEKLLSLGTAFSTQKSLWLLPKGRNAEAELAALDASWQGEYRLEPSVTDAEAQIIVATGVRRAAPRRVGKDKRR